MSEADLGLALMGGVIGFAAGILIVIFVARERLFS